MEEKDSIWKNSLEEKMAYLNKVSKGVNLPQLRH